ncbi:kinase-like domain-containing protein [Paraphysoderma sedebokerense]|nr:kinase-like domain-containing protein [Paraphysoderma sedebokerense]
MIRPHSFFAKAFSSNAKSMPTISVDPPKIPDNELELLNADPDSLLPSERKERERLLQVYGKNWNEQKGSSNKTAHNISSSEPTLFQTLSHDSPKKITINGDKSSASKTSSFFSRFVLSKSSSSESIDGAGKNPAFVSERPSSTPPVHQPLAATPSTEIPDSTVTSTSSFSSSQSDGPLTINTRHTLPRAGVKVALTSPTTEGPKTITKPYGTGSLDDYTVLKTLGVGSFSKVRLARRTRDGTLVALKMISKKGMIAHAKFRECLENEIDLLNTLDHPNIVKLHEVIDTPTHVCLVLDYHEGGELFDYIAYHHKEITEDMAKDMVRQLVDVLDYLHRSNVCHRDLKLENILLARRTPPFKLIVTDFGLARRLVPTDPIQSAASATKSSHLPPLLTDLLTTRVGSEEYSSPEIITGKPYDGKIADFWSLGVVVYALIVGWLPFCVEERDVVVEEKVVVDVNASDANGTLTQSGNGTHTQHNSPHTPRKESVKLLRQLQDIYRSNGSSHPSSHPSSQSSPVTPSSLPPSPFPSSATSSFASPSQTTPADPTTASVTTTTTTTVRRTYSTKRAGRKALWHRISRSEFHFPDEVVTFVKGENGELKLEQSHGSTHPHNSSSTTDDASVKEKEIRGKYKLLTPDSKEVIRGLLSRKASERWGVKEIRECKWLNS